MTQLTEHFALEEFQKGDPIPPECVDIFTDLASDILEPVRAQFGTVQITSGYRSPEENAEAHGQPNSEHMATARKCAGDFFVQGIQNQRPVFDWMRMNASLPFHQLIFESDSSGGAVIHVSINKDLPGVRSVLIGATHNAEPYQKADYVAYMPPIPGSEEHGD